MRPNATRSALPRAEQYLEVGYNYRMTDLQAAVGLVQLAKLDEVVARRRELAGSYQRLLADVPGLRAVRGPRARGSRNFQSFWVEVGRSYPLDRERAAGASRRRRRSRLGAASWPRIASPPTPARPGTSPLPATERLTDNTLILPLFHP